jgi:uncharacterized protein
MWYPGKGARWCRSCGLRCEGAKRWKGRDPMKDGRRILLIVCGTLCVALGVLGMFLPILPTTPFLLLAAFCYGRSSQRAYRWLMSNRWFGEYIRNYRDGRGIPLKQKILTITLLWLTIGYTVLFVVSHWWVKLILLAIAGGVTVHLTRARTLKAERQDPRVLIERDSPEEPF